MNLARRGRLERDDPVARDEADSDPAVATVDLFRRITVGLVLASAVLATFMTFWWRISVDPVGTAVIDLLIAGLLLISRVLWLGTTGWQLRIADAFGTVALVFMGGMACGAIAMLSLRFGLPLADERLWAWDRSLGFNGIAMTEALVRQGQWIFTIMALLYKFTIPLFVTSLVVQSLRGERVEAWRGAFCFVATLLTVCMIALFVPAKGLGMWAPPELLHRLPDGAMRAFWPHFDDFYLSPQPVLRLEVIDGVISFPSFHSIVGILTVALWRKNIVTLSIGLILLAFMLLATLPYGGHYIVDLIAGAFVWLAWFAISRRIEQAFEAGVPRVVRSAGEAPA